MATDLILPDGLAPSNLHLRSSVKQRWVDGDVFMIADRLRREVSPRLHVIELEENAKVAWAIMEHGDDGVEYLVTKVDALDARIIEKCQYLIRVPLQVRVKLLEEENERWEAEQHDNTLEEMYDKFGRLMWYRLEKDGFNAGRGVSFPKRGVTPTAA